MLGPVGVFEFDVEVVWHVAHHVQDVTDLGLEVVLHGEENWFGRPDMRTPNLRKRSGSLKGGKGAFRRVFAWNRESSGFLPLRGRVRSTAIQPPEEPRNIFINWECGSIEELKKRKGYCERYRDKSRSYYQRIQFD